MAISAVHLSRRKTIRTVSQVGTKSPVKISPATENTRPVTIRTEIMCAFVGYGTLALTGIVCSLYCVINGGLGRMWVLAAAVSYGVVAAGAIWLMAASVTRAIRTGRSGE